MLFVGDAEGGLKMDDLISRQDALDAIRECGICEQRILDVPSAQPEIIRCKDCRWWDRESEDSPMGYCHACKHGHYSRHWEINIRRVYEEDFYCADAEPKESEDKE